MLDQRIPIFGRHPVGRDAGNNESKDQAEGSPKEDRLKVHLLYVVEQQSAAYYMLVVVIFFVKLFWNVCKGGSKTKSGPEDFLGEDLFPFSAGAHSTYMVVSMAWSICLRRCRDCVNLWIATPKFGGDL